MSDNKYLLILTYSTCKCSLENPANLSFGLLRKKVMDLQIVQCDHKPYPS